MHFGMFSKLSHALFNILSKLLKVNIEISFNWRKLINNNLFNQLSFDSVQLLRWIHCIDSINFLVKSIDLLLASIERDLKFYQFLFKIIDRLNHAFLAFHHCRWHYVCVLHCGQWIFLERGFNLKSEWVMVFALSFLFLSFALSWRFTWLTLSWWYRGFWTIIGNIDNIV